MSDMFTKERIIYAVITGLFLLAGSYVTARSSAEETISNFKIENAKELGAVKADIQTNKAINDQQYNEIGRRLENIEGSLKTLTSGVYQIINR